MFLRCRWNIKKNNEVGSNAPTMEATTSGGGYG
jgi:hypothetical protein